MKSFAVVPACGHSTRMGRPKLALPIGDRSVIEHVVASLRKGGVERVLVVVGPHVPELVSLANAAGADARLLPEATPDMRATVERGLVWIEQDYHPSPDDFWMLAPADHPAFSPAVVHQLFDAATNSDHSIAVPIFNGRRGHPTLLHWKHAAGIRALRTGAGINAYLRGLQTETLEVAVSDPGILVNLDTPEDYESLCEGR